MVRRFCVFAFGLAAYLLFLLTVLYAVGYVGGVYVRKGLDGGLNPSPALGLAADLGLIALFGIQHSVMARPSFKRWAARLIPEAANRSVFVLSACLSLWLLFWQWRPIPVYLWNVPSGPLYVLLEILYGLGWLIAILSTFLINHFDFTGVRQVWGYLMVAPYRPVDFKKRWLYKVVRHPMMLGLLIIIG